MADKENATKLNWLKRAQELLSIAEAGLMYSKNEFDLQRFARIKEISGEMAAFATGEAIERIKGIFDKETGYQTPKIDVRGAIFKDGKILLVRENIDSGKWTLPGGWGEPWDTPRANVEREVLEETGLTVHARKIAAVYDRATQGHTKEFFNSYKLFFICDVVGGEFQKSIETGEARFFAEGEIPNEEEISIRRIRRGQLLQMFEHLRHPEIPTYFD